MVTITGTNNDLQPQYNRVIDYTLTPFGYSEAVSVTLAKQWARVTTGTEEDDLFELLIVAAREAIEAFTGLSLTPKAAEVTMLVPQPLFELPYGPVISTPSFVNFQDDSIDVNLIGFDFPKIQNGFSQVITATYNVGYDSDNLPSQLKTAWLNQIVFMYENRGDNSDTATLCKSAQYMCQNFTRQPWFQ